MGASESDGALFDDPAPTKKGGAAKPAAASEADGAMFDDEPAPKAPPVVRKPAAPFIPETPPTAGAVARDVAGQVGQGFANVGRAAWSGLGAIGDDILHPVRTFQGSPLARAIGASTPEAVARNQAEQREVMRGVNSNVPGANRFVEAIGGPPAESPEDAARVPGASTVGFAAGLPLGGMAAESGGALLRGAGEASIARSAARSAENAAPVRAAIKAAGRAVKENALEIGRDAVLGSVTGHGGGVAATSAALRLGKPFARAAGTAADEGVAAIARRLIAKRTAGAAPAIAAEAAPAISEEVGPMQAAGWDPEGWKYDQAPAAADATPSAPPAAEAAPSLGERAAAIKETRPAPASLAHRAESITREMPAISMDDLVYGKRPPSEVPAPAAPAPVEAPKWEPSKYDDKYARKQKVSPAEYRATMDRWLSNAHKTMQDPHATAAAKARAVQVLRSSRTNVPAAGELDEAAAQ